MKKNVEVWESVMARCLSRAVVFILILCGVKLMAAAANCEIPVPYCELSFADRILLPESYLHDEVPQWALEPQTDIFLNIQISAIDGIKSKYPHIDPKNEIPNRPLELALSYYDRLKDILKRTEFLGIIDYKQYSHNPRLFLVDMQTGRVEKLLVSHGEGSDPKNSGYATIFSNRDNSHMSSLGAFITAETYNGKNGLSLRIDGIEESNSNMRKRAVVIHGSDYTKESLNPIGMSWGCPAVNHVLAKALIQKIKAGVLFYSWYNQ
jgi:hypothetical protein